MVPGAGEIDPAGWLGRFDDMFAPVVAPAFFRREPRLRAHSYLLGLVSGVERKNGWTLAEFAGDAKPVGMQRLLNAARWDEDAVRDALGRYLPCYGKPGKALDDKRLRSPIAIIHGDVRPAIW
jgi:pimeloyl-ACP methyl ester carboxylesterase